MLRRDALNIVMVSIEEIGDVAEPEAVDVGRARWKRLRRRG
jgi:hypothetical protein